MRRGHAVVAAMWAMTALSLSLLALRLYTRLRIVRFIGAEDHLYFWTGILLLGFTACIQVSVHYGLGRSFCTLTLDDSSNAIFWTYVANTFAVTGNAMAKLSMGSFLLRVVQARAQKAALWSLIFVTAATSTALVVMLWNQTTPIKTSWDPLRTPGTWNIQIQPMSVGLGVWSSICDLFFAIFPWLFIWPLHMSRREKIVLASGMSLGVLAGGCGIARTAVLARLDIMDYTLNFAGYFAWAGAEIAVAMVCLAIPTLRPLYLRARGRSVGYERQRSPRPDEPESFEFTLCEPKPPAAQGAPSQDTLIVRPSSDEMTSPSDQIPLPRPAATHTMGHTDQKSASGAFWLSDEQIHRHVWRPPGAGNSEARIRTEHVTVNEEPRNPNWPLKT
ncbi:hypothetical protein C8A03DRAFT_44871 [Achaetomium macrosporum]|uniref:Rhodopsin domain-containing protein n=1 Tax=Achaetomium macrosporum TaxID=79813 RepID=A0AAN7C8A5_9PEZI|nr:hypothetical protein C8A03DRAFT_44871 [Achaetomium macrosporum]